MFQSISTSQIRQQGGPLVILGWCDSVQPLQRLRRSRLKMHLSLNARVMQHRGEAKPDITRCFRCISPLATAGSYSPHLSPAPYHGRSVNPKSRSHYSLAPDYKCIQFHI